MQISGIILAGGEGRRMGGVDKALILLGDRPLVGHAVAGLGLQVARLAISANGDPARLASWGLPVLPDAAPRGPLSGVLAGLTWAEGAIVTVAVDTPRFPADLVARLARAATPAAPVAIAASGRDLHPTFALWPATVAPALRAFLASGAKARVTDFARMLGMVAVPFGPGDFHNINTAGDLAAAKARLA